jgi:hypothetical protein
MNNGRWILTRKSCRAGVMRVLDEIERGKVTAEDLTKLRNFCAVALMVQNKITERVWDVCVKEAEIAAHLHGQIVDLEEIL